MDALSSVAFFAIPAIMIVAAPAYFLALLRRFRRGAISRNRAAVRYGLTVLYPVLAMAALWAVLEWVSIKLREPSHLIAKRL